MKVHDINFKGLSVKSVEITKEDIQLLCILGAGITAMIVLPSPSLKIKALGMTMTALTAKAIR